MIVVSQDNQLAAGQFRITLPASLHMLNSVCHLYGLRLCNGQCTAANAENTLNALRAEIGLREAAGLLRYNPKV